MKTINEMGIDELLEFLGITASLEEVFRNYSYTTEEEMVEHLREAAIERQQKII